MTEHAQIKAGRGHIKATNEQLTASYARTRSVWKTAAEFSMCGQSVHERLNKLGLCTRQDEFTPEQQSDILAVYASGIQKGDGKIKALVARVGKSRHNICRWARKAGVTNLRRKLAPSCAAVRRERLRAMWKQRPHPKGMLGKKHTKETRAKMSKAFTGRKVSWETRRKIIKTKLLKYGNQHMPHGSWKAGWREIGGQRIYARSRWEANYASYLEFLRVNGQIAKWEHEPKTFWFNRIKRSDGSYLPDFRVTENDGSVVYHEVKGWMDERSRIKINRMKLYYPSVKLTVLDSAWFKANSRELSATISGWEDKNSVLT